MEGVMAKDWHSLYRDPRWQKKRLEVLERTEWCCQACGDGEKELHVHHAYYTGSKKPWEYPDESLSALCNDCHKYAEELRQSFKRIGMFPIEVQEAFEQLIKAFELMETNGCRIVNADDVHALAERLYDAAFEVVWRNYFKGK
jgi:hypothetical protein